MLLCPNKNFPTLRKLTSSDYQLIRLGNSHEIAGNVFMCNNNGLALTHITCQNIKKMRQFISRCGTGRSNSIC